jgi:hypothetical protein
MQRFTSVSPATPEVEIRKIKVPGQHGVCVGARWSVMRPIISKEKKKKTGNGDAYLSSQLLGKQK